MNLITTGTSELPLPRPLGEIAIDEFKIYDGNNNLILWNTLGSINEIQNSSVGLNGIFNNVGDVHFIPGVSGNAVMAKPVWARGVEPDKEYNLTTTNLTDNFYTQNGNDTINSTFANLQQKDVLNASGGIDTLIITLGVTTDSIAFNASNTINQVNIPGTTITNFERFDLSGFLGMTNFSGSTGSDWVKAGTGNDYLGGGDGNDYLNGGAGIDTMGGGLGDDTYVIDNLADAVIEFFNNGVDTIESPFTWTLATNLENLVLTGTSHLNGTGNELDNTLSGNSGNNILDGLLGGDRLMGGLGNDTYIVDNIRDVVTENANEGQDLVQATVNTTLTNNVEDLTLLGTANINGTGNNANNILTGNSGANLLKGLNGNDTLSGGAGNDTLIGGLGNDR
ncbi:MAG: calcium-binding protein, partial [Microcystaceae cyanobacterium]